MHLLDFHVLSFGWENFLIFFEKKVGFCCCDLMENAYLCPSHLMGKTINLLTTKTGGCYATEHEQRRNEGDGAGCAPCARTKVLGIDGWVPFEQLWHRQNMRQDYNKSQYNQKTDEFEKELKRKLK